VKAFQISSRTRGATFGGHQIRSFDPGLPPRVRLVRPPVATGVSDKGSESRCRQVVILGRTESGDRHLRLRLHPRTATDRLLRFAGSDRDDSPPTRYKQTEHRQDDRVQHGIGPITAEEGVRWEPPPGEDRGPEPASASDDRSPRRIPAFRQRRGRPGPDHGRHLFVPQQRGSDRHPPSRERILLPAQRPAQAPREEAHLPRGLLHRQQSASSSPRRLKRCERGCPLDRSPGGDGRARGSR
jgi:hypothetical protein